MITFPQPVAIRSIELSLPACILAGPRITEVSLSPEESLRYMVATHISVLMVLLPCNRIAAPLSVFVEGMSYSVIKVQKNGFLYNNQQIDLHFSATNRKKVKNFSFYQIGIKLALHWQCFAISLAFHMCYDIHAPSSTHVLPSI